jgi:hypothetical protein
MLKPLVSALLCSALLCSALLCSTAVCASNPHAADPPGHESACVHRLPQRYCHLLYCADRALRRVQTSPTASPRRASCGAASPRAVRAARGFRGWSALLLLLRGWSVLRRGGGCCSPDRRRAFPGARRVRALGRARRGFGLGCCGCCARRSACRGLGRARSALHVCRRCGGCGTRIAPHVAHRPSWNVHRLYECWGLRCAVAVALGCLAHRWVR